mgnify:CR=1 FL=1
MSASPPSNPLPGPLDGLHHKVNKLFLKKNKKTTEIFSVTFL